MVDFLPYILVVFDISQEILSGWLICLTSLADFLLYILVDFYISQKILVVDLFGWLVWLTSYKHSNWLSFQPGNTFSWLICLTTLADFLLYIRLTFISARKYFWLTPLLTFCCTFWLSFISTRKYFPVDLFGRLFWLTCFYTFWLTYLVVWLTYSVDFLVDFLLDILVDFP